MNYIQIIITILITAVITHFLTVYRERKQWNRTLELQKIQDYNKAADSFRNAFTKEIRLISKPYTPRDDLAYYIINRAIARHEEAVITFKAYLCNTDISSLDKAWEEYGEPNKDKSPSNVREEYFSNGDKEKEKEIRKRIIHRIKTLLKFAKT